MLRNYFYKPQNNILFEFNGQTYSHEDILPKIVGIEGGLESLNGSEKDDILIGGSSANRLSGKAGDDILYGEEGDDKLLGKRWQRCSLCGLGNECADWWCGG